MIGYIGRYDGPAANVRSQRGGLRQVHCFPADPKAFRRRPVRRSVMIDGRDVREYNIHYLRRAVCMVAQKSVLFKMTMRDNIAYGMKPMPSDAEIVAVT